MPEKKWIGWVVIMISLHRHYLGKLIRLPEWRHATRPQGVTRRGARDDDRKTSGGAGYFNLPRWRITYEKSVTLHRKIVNLHLYSKPHLFIYTHARRRSLRNLSFNGRLRLPSFRRKPAAASSTVEAKECTNSLPPIPIPPHAKNHNPHPHPFAASAATACGIGTREGRRK